MPSTLLQAKDFLGLTPALDRRKLSQPAIIGGTNFVFDADGPRTAFGNECVTYTKIEDPEFVCEIRVEGQPFLFCKEKVLGWSASANDYVVLYEFDATSELTPWSWARVGNSYYFCRAGVGVISYNYLTEVWDMFENAYLPADPYAVTFSNGRLIILGSDAYAWSALDDGADLTPSLVTGAGAQSLTIIGGSPLGLEYVQDGFLVFTTIGIVKAEFANTAYVWRHFVLVPRATLISPFTIINIPNTGVIYLTKQGFFLTNGGVPTQWEDLMSEYFRQMVLPNADLNGIDTLRMYYAEDQEYIMFQQGSSGAPHVYFSTFVYYLPVQKWGVFNANLTAFVSVYRARNLTSGLWLGYVDNHGVVRRFITSASVEVYPTTVPVPAGYIRQTASLNAYVEIGLFRFIEQKESDETSVITSLTVGTSPGGIVDEIEDYVNDYLYADVYEDWLLITPDAYADWGFNLPSSDVYTVELLDTNDGYNASYFPWQTLGYVDNLGSGYVYYPQGAASIYHVIRVSATKPGEYFHLKYIDIAGQLTGRLEINQ